jgi:hypothetical protein
MKALPNSDCISVLSLPARGGQMKKIFFAAILVLAVSAAFDAYADDEPLHSWTYYQLSLSHPFQLFPKEADVYGVRLNFFDGLNRDVKGLDAGNLNIVTNNASGIQLGFLQNMVRYEMKGIQIALGDNDAGSMKGIQTSMCFNNVMRSNPEFTKELGEEGKGDFSGVQMAAGFNYGDWVQGIQFGFFCNAGHEVQGVQFGLVNYASRMSGIQIGLINCIEEEGFQTTLPLFNIGLAFLSSEEETPAKESKEPEE